MIRAIEFYSGIGGLHLALRRSGVDAEVVRAFDWDPAASQVYLENWGNVVKRVDIARLTASELIPLDASLWLLSPACQPYTVLNASAKGAADPRARSFLHIIESVLPDLVQHGAQPRLILIENVAGFESSTTRQSVLKTLHALRYITEEFLLTPLQFSIPNSRLRYYLLAKFPPLSFSGSQTPNEPPGIRRSIPGHGPDWKDPRQTFGHECDPDPCCPQLTHFLDDPKRAQDPGYWQAFAVPDKVLQKKGVLFDIVLPSYKRTCCFTRGYAHMVEGTSILQMNESLDTSTMFNAYAAAAAADDPNRMDILRSLRLRYFTPEELLRIFQFCPSKVDPTSPTFDFDFRWPACISQKTKYRLIGNSVNVKVVQKLISYLLIADDTPNHHRANLFKMA